MFLHAWLFKRRRHSFPGRAGSNVGGMSHACPRMKFSPSGVCPLLSRSYVKARARAQRYFDIRINGKVRRINARADENVMHVHALKLISKCLIFMQIYGTTRFTRELHRVSHFLLKY